jgi:hypothetical protein
LLLADFFLFQFSFLVLKQGNVVARVPGVNELYEGLVERFVKWADPQVLRQMRDVFSHYDEADAKWGLLAAISLFRALAFETAERLGYSYPWEANTQVTKWIRARFQKQIPAREKRDGGATVIINVSIHSSSSRHEPNDLSFIAFSSWFL